MKLRRYWILVLSLLVVVNSADGLQGNPNQGGAWEMRLVFEKGSDGKAIGTAAPAAGGQPTQSTSSDAPRKAGDVVIEQVSRATPETGEVKFEMGTIYVPENRADPKSRIIGVGFARLPALQPTGAPPMFHLPGGPGSSFLARLKQDDARALRYAARFRRVGDVIFVDQRGFSERGEVLKVKVRKPAEPLDQPCNLARSTALFVEMARAAVREFATKQVDLRGYTVKECADDVDDLRRALGYERITLVGASFGSQWSFAIMRRHPEIVARALLHGVEPLDYGYDMPSHVFAAIQRMWWEAEKDPRLKPYLPPGGLMAATREILRRLDRAPIQVKVGTTTVTLGREDFQRFFPRGTNGPAFLLSLYHERYEQWAQRVMNGRRELELEPELIGPLIDTSLGVTPRREYLLRTDPATEFMGQWSFDNYIASADIFPTPDVGDDFRSDVVSRIPVVFAQGDWDTSTPLENTLNVAPYFINSRVLIAVHGGHGVLGPIAENFADVGAALLDFLQTGSTANIPARVILPAPKFEVPNFPPPAAK